MVSDKNQMEIIERKDIQVNKNVLRHCIYIINKLLSYEESGPFATPVPLDAYIYYERIKQPMDFATLEKNVYDNKYPSDMEFEADLSRIWKNAMEFHHTIDTIYKQAEALRNHYHEVFTNIQRMPFEEKKILIQKPIPEEHLPLFTTNLFDFDANRDIYMVQVVLPMEKSKAIRGYGKKLRTLYDDLNKHLYDCMNDDDFFNKYKKNMIPLPRLYVCKNRTLLTEACKKPASYVTILSNVKSTIPTTFKNGQRKDIMIITFDVTIGLPMSENVHRFEPFALDTDTTTHLDYCPKAFIKLLPLKTYHHVSAVISTNMEKQYFRHAFTNHRLQYNPPIVSKPIIPSNLPAKRGRKPKKEMKPQSPTVDQPLVQRLMRAIWTGESNSMIPNEENNQIPCPSLSSSPPSSSSLPASFLTSTNIKTTTVSSLPPSPSAAYKNLVTKKLTLRPPFVTTVKLPPLEETKPAPSTSSSSSLTPKYEEKPSISPFPKKEPINHAPIINTLSTIMKDKELMEATNKYYQDSQKIINELKKYAALKNVPVEKVTKYAKYTTTYANAEGYFKQVRYVDNDKSIVVQTFRRTTTTQRLTEIVCLLKLKDLPHMAHIKEILEDDEGNIVGLTMKRYEYTLKQYTHEHSHHALSAHQKWDIIQQILNCLQTIHENGISHRDLSEVNFMVNKNTKELLKDGSPSAQVHLIDFGKAIFTQQQDVEHWWIKPIPTFIKERREQLLSASSLSSSSSTPILSTSSSLSYLDQLVSLTSSSSSTPLSPLASSIPTTCIAFWTSLFEYEGEVIPETEEKLQEWCQALPWIQVKPDHGYRHYRSIQTLPRNRTDHEILPWLVDPIAEDMYSIGTIIWKIFSGMEPWHGILDNDLRGLREIVESDRRLTLRLNREVNGDLSKELLLLSLKTQPEDRKSAHDILNWLDQPNIKEGLIEEWNQYAPTERKRRKAKPGHQFEEEQAKQFQNTSYFPNSIINKNRIKKKRKTTETSSTSTANPVGRKKYKTKNNKGTNNNDIQNNNSNNNNNTGGMIHIDGMIFNNQNSNNNYQQHIYNNNNNNNNYIHNNINNHYPNNSNSNNNNNYHHTYKIPIYPSNGLIPSPSITSSLPSTQPPLLSTTTSSTIRKPLPTIIPALPTPTSSQSSSEYSLPTELKPLKIKFSSRWQTTSPNYNTD
ncbi:unnamed protein product [Cunninghamella echinulata]